MRNFAWGIFGFGILIIAEQIKLNKKQNIFTKPIAIIDIICYNNTVKKLIKYMPKSYMTYPEWRRDVPYETTATYLEE